MLHTSFGQPQEFKLSVNLRSPRRIADLVNRAWDFYDYLHKQDRPSGTGYAEIDDDSPDQILYATLPSPGLSELLLDLSRREGLVLIAFDKTNLPKETLPFVLSPAEAKGLDFHSVCVVNGGSLLRRIVNQRAPGCGLDALAKRLAIDQLRVALSRPTERLLWVDTSPDAKTVNEVSRLLRPPNENALPPITVEALLTCLEEEELEIRGTCPALPKGRPPACSRETRLWHGPAPIRPWRCWGLPSDFAGVTDRAARDGTCHLAEVCFQLAFRKIRLCRRSWPPDLYEQAAQAARSGGKFLLANASCNRRGGTQHGAERLKIALAVQAVAEAREELPGWFTIEITPRADAWLDELDRNLEAGDNPLLAQRILPPFFDALGLPDAQARKDRLAQRAVQILMKNRRHTQALTILERLPEAKPKLVAECYEETGQFAKAATIYLELGDREKALSVTGPNRISLRPSPWFDRWRAMPLEVRWNGYPNWMLCSRGVQTTSTAR